ncbi:MAG TPA: LysM domain-containing protein [Gaiellaceae bacterium]|nr:LysM domain-containing protein [Gaiellaceae bacterium]
MEANLRRYAAPAAFLAAVTLAVVLVRAGVEAGSKPAAPTTAQTSARQRTVRRVAAHTHTHAHRTARYWTVRAGDTFGTISAKTGVPVTTIERLNPRASSTTLTIGEKVRIR